MSKSSVSRTVQKRNEQSEDVDSTHQKTKLEESDNVDTETNKKAETKKKPVKADDNEVDVESSSVSRRKRTVKVDTESTESKKKTSRAKDKKEDHRTNETVEAGLYFNVQPFKKWLKSYYENNGMNLEFPRSQKSLEAKVKSKSEKPAKETKKKTKKNSDGDEESGSSINSPNCSGVQFALSAVVERTCRFILSEVISSAKKDVDSANLYQLKTDTLMDAVRSNSKLSEHFKKYLDQFVQSTTYTKNLEDCIPVKHFKKFVESVVGSNVNENNSLNLVAYLLYSVLVEYANRMYFLAMYAKKKNFGFEIAKYATSMIFSESSDLGKQLSIVLNDTMTRVGEHKKKSSGEKKAKAEGAGKGKSKSSKDGESGKSKLVKDDEYDEPEPKPTKSAKQTKQSKQQIEE